MSWFPRRAAAAGAALVLLAGLAGCAKKPPAVVEVTGVVLLGGQPLPKANVQFVPQLEEFGAEFNSSAVTDEQGRFTLTLMNQQPGAAVGRHKVLVTEHTPDEFRGEGARAQEGMARFRAGLKNRPIPEVYGNVLMSPLEVEVKADQKEYTINLSR
jgi:hypothetical protein